MFLGDLASTWSGITSSKPWLWRAIRFQTAPARCYVWRFVYVTHLLQVHTNVSTLLLQATTAYQASEILFSITLKVSTRRKTRRLRWNDSDTKDASKHKYGSCNWKRAFKKGLLAKNGVKALNLADAISTMVSKADIILPNQSRAISRANSKVLFMCPPRERSCSQGGPQKEAGAASDASSSLS